MLGGFALVGPDGAPVQGLTHRRFEAVLAVLAVAGDLGCSRDHLLGLLWPESDEAHARHNVSAALHALRHSLGGDAVLASGEDLRLNPAVIQSDVRQFTQSRAAPMPAEAVQAYGGPLLAGFHMDHAPDFERWLDYERARLGREYGEALERLATGEEAEGRWSTAAAWWNRAVERDPHNTRLVIRLMRALAAAGDRANALREGEVHRERLLEELELAPAPELLAEIARIRSAAVSTPAGALPPPAPTVESATVRASAAAVALPAQPATERTVSGMRLRRRWRRSVLAGIGGTLLLVLAGGAAWLVAHRSPRLASGERIAILPLVPAVADSALSRLGRDVMVELSSNLDGVGAISTAAPASVLKRLGDRVGSVAPDRAAALAGSLGAASVLTGSLVRAGNRVRADAQLVSVRGLKPLARVSVAVDSQDASGLADSLAWAVLEQVWHVRGAATPFTVARRTKSFDALRAFLAAEEALRAGRKREAVASFVRAIDADSSFWLAYWGVWYTNWWSNLAPSSRAIERTVWEHRGELAEPDRLLVEAYLGPRTRWSQTLSRLQDLSRRYPDYAPCWWAMGDITLHWGVGFGHPVSEARAEIERAVALDPSLEEAWLHLSLVALDADDSALSARVLRAMGSPGTRDSYRRAYGWDVAGLFGIAHRVRFEHAAVTPVVMDSLVEAGAPGGGWLGSYVGALPASVALDLSRRWLSGAASPERRASMRILRASLWTRRGAWDSALVEMDRYVAASGDSTAALRRYGLAAVGAWLAALPADSAALRRPPAAAQATSRALRAELAWHDGLVAAARRDVAGVRAARAALQASGFRGAELPSRALAELELEIRGQRRAAAEELVALVNLASDSATADFPFTAPVPLTFAAVTRLAASRWLGGLGEPSRALTLLYPTDSWGTFPQWLERSLALLQRAHLAESLGRTGQAARDYEWFLREFDMPVAPLRHLVTEARQSLARLRAPALHR